jgi:hypothetical protein
MLREFQGLYWRFGKKEKLTACRELNPDIFPSIFQPIQRNS